MAAYAKDGSAHHSAGRASLHDEMHSSSKPPVKQMEKPKGDGEGKGQMSIEEHVDAHGPAHTIHYAHDKKTDKHHVHSTHGDGMVHKSEHASAEEAHSHMGKAMDLAGENEEQERDEESPDQEYAEEQPSSGVHGLV